MAKGIVNKKGKRKEKKSYVAPKKEDVKQLQSCLRQASSCINGVEYKPTKCGGVVKKGNRKLAVTVSPFAKAMTFRIRRNRTGKYFLGVNSFDTLSYYDIKDTIKKGLKGKE